MLEINTIKHGIAISKELGIAYDPSIHTVLSRVNSQGELMGGFLFTDYTGKSITVHMQGFLPMWMSRSMLWVLFDYPFIQLGVKKLLAPISSGNFVTLSIAYRLGFHMAACVADVYKDGDLVLLETTSSQCRWMKRPSPIKRAA